MKRILLISGFALSLLFSACEGPAGPPGPPGFDGIDGADGVNILGQVFEMAGDFTPENDYSLLTQFPQNLEVFESDIVLVYLLWDQTEDGDGEPVDIWRLLPQTRILEQGLLQYNFDHTFFDVSVFLESDFDLGTLQPGDTDDQVFRIAVLPADFLQGGKIDVANLNSVMAGLNVSESDIQRFEN